MAEDRPKKKEKEKDPEEERMKEAANKILEEMGLKGASKRRLVMKLIAQYKWDIDKVRYKAKRAFITDRYNAAAEHV